MQRKVTQNCCHRTPLGELTALLQTYSWSRFVRYWESEGERRGMRRLGRERNRNGRDGEGEGEGDAILTQFIFQF